MTKTEEIKVAAGMVKHLEETQLAIRDISKTKNTVAVKMSKTDGPDFETTIYTPSYLGLEIKLSILGALRDYEKYLIEQIENVSI